LSVDHLEELVSGASGSFCAWVDSQALCLMHKSSRGANSWLVMHTGRIGGLDVIDLDHVAQIQLDDPGANVTGQLAQTKSQSKPHPAWPGVDIAHIVPGSRTRAF